MTFLSNLKNLYTSKIFLNTNFLLFAKIVIYSADLNFIHYAGELGGGTDIIPGEFEGVYFHFILIYRRSSYLARIN